MPTQPPSTPTPPAKRIILSKMLFTAIALSCTFFIISLLVRLLFSSQVIFLDNGKYFIPFIKTISPSILTYSFIFGFIFGIPLAAVRLLSKSTTDFARNQKLEIKK